jgi:hypothetical protein
LQTKAAAAATANPRHSAFSSIPGSSLSSGSVKNEARSGSPLDKGKAKLIDPPSLPIIPVRFLDAMGACFFILIMHIR